MVRASDARRVVLGDRTGTLEAAPCQIAAGSCVRVVGTVESRGRLDVRSVRDAKPGEYDLDDLLDGPRIPVDRMEADLRALIATIQCDHLRGLLDRVFGVGTPTWEQFREAPAAKRFHQAYRHGLLEHSLDRGPGRLGDQRHVRRRGSRRGGHRRAAARHRQAGRLHVGPAGDRHDGPRQAPGRDPARVLPGAPDHRGPARVPVRARGRRAPHHPEPPRPARARLAGRALHPRGDVGPHAGQPRRAAGLLRPVGEGAA